VAGIVGDGARLGVWATLIPEDFGEKISADLGLRGIKQGFRGTGLHDLAGGEESDGIGGFASKAHGVGDDDQRPSFGAELEDEVEHFGGHFRVESGRRFVEEEEVGFAGYGARNGHALLLAAGKSCRFFVGVIGKLESFEGLDGDLFRSAFPEPVDVLERKRDVIEGG
jgi:hypothetical protein